MSTENPINNYSLMKGSGEHGEHGDTMPTQRLDAIQAWHGAYSRVIAYAWANWDNHPELNNIIAFPEYYLAEYGFNPEITSYQTKIKFVITPGDTVEYVHGKKIVVSTNDGDEAKVISTTDFNEIPPYGEEENSTITIKPLTELFAEQGIEDDEEAKKRLAVIQQLDETAPLTNGWGKTFEKFKELTGVFVAVIPPKPKNQADELQGLNDYMELCINQPFTCA